MRDLLIFDYFRFLNKKSSVVLVTEILSTKATNPFTHLNSLQPNTLQSSGNNIMSLLHSNMLNNQFNSFTPDHLRSHSYNELLNQFKSSISRNGTSTGNKELGASSVNIKKRSYSDFFKESNGQSYNLENKRSRTAPPSPPYNEVKYTGNSNNIQSNMARARSLSPVKSLEKYTLKENTLKRNHSETRETRGEVQHDNNRKIKLPSIESVLKASPLSTKMPIKLKPITPTVSLDYFDTYKPNDENWRYELLDSISKCSKHFNLKQYNYLNNHASSGNNLPYKPSFDSRISSKIKNPTMIPKLNSNERKINFPYESNYTYLNKTYLNDVEKYPEYLELAHSLIQLSQSKHNSRAELPTMLRNDKSNNQVCETPISKNSVPLLTPLNSYVYSQPEVTNYSLATPMSANQISKPYQSYVNMASETPSVQEITKKSVDSSETRFIPLTPPSSKSKSKHDVLRSPPKNNHPRICLSCGSDQSPCWRPSWAINEGQLCNSCGLRYKKTSCRCLNEDCKKIPAKGEWSLMQSKGKATFDDGSHGYSCLDCGWRVEVKK